MGHHLWPDRPFDYVTSVSQSVNGAASVRLERHGATHWNDMLCYPTAWIELDLKRTNHPMEHN